MVTVGGWRGSRDEGVRSPIEDAYPVGLSSSNPRSSEDAEMGERGLKWAVDEIGRICKNYEVINGGINSGSNQDNCYSEGLSIDVGAMG